MLSVTGGTIAWFTDTVTSEKNVIAAGNLDVELLWAEGKEDPRDTALVWQDASKSTLFNYSLWEPGYVEAKHIQIVNAGNLTLKYQLKIKATGVVSPLADAIDVYFIEDARKVTREDLNALQPVGTLAEMIADADGAAYGALLPKDAAATNAWERMGTVTATIALKMRESAGNEYQNLAIGSKFAVQLQATQYTYEEDGFDHLYDEAADYAKTPVLPEVAALRRLMAGGEEDGLTKVNAVVYGTYEQYGAEVAGIEGVRAEEDSSVMVYRVEKDGKVTVYFLGDMPIKLPEDSTGLFHDMTGLTTVDATNMDFSNVVSTQSSCSADVRT